MSGMSDSQRRDAALVLLLTGACLLTAWWIANAPVKAWLVVGVITAVALLEVQPLFWGASAVLAATVIRLATAFGAPHFLNFAHFPLIAGGLLVAMLKGRSTTLSRTLGSGLLAFLFVNMISWAFNGGEVLRPLLDWLVLTEPFLFVYIFSLCPIDSKGRRLLWYMVIGVSALQIPIAYLQWILISHGNPDRVQGTFIGQGAGAHIAGAMALLGALITVCQATAGQNVLRKPLLLCSAALLFSVAVLADAKQTILAFTVAMIYAVASASGKRIGRLFVPVAYMSAVVVIAFALYAPLQLIFNHALISGGVQGKIAVGDLIFTRLLNHRAGWVLGVGPGNSVSRVSLLTTEAHLDMSSPLAALGLKTAPLTSDLLAISAGNYIWNSSSAFSSECSWFGLIGDLGLLGTAVYLYLGFTVWRGMRSGWQGAASKSAIIAAVLLGGISSWLEEPGFVLPIALMASLSQLDLSLQEHLAGPRSLISSLRESRFSH